MALTLKVLRLGSAAQTKYKSESVTYDHGPLGYGAVL